jgi:hypothetical protein
LLRGVSTRQYEEVLPEMAANRRRLTELRQPPGRQRRELRQLQERRWEQVGLFAIYIDGQRWSHSANASAS